MYMKLWIYTTGMFIIEVVFTLDWVVWQKTRKEDVRER
jgi:hypothetical protein